MKNKLVLIRHGESTWNKSNTFTGWTDIDLTEKGIKEAHKAGAILKKEGYDFDICYTSILKRAIHSLNDTLDILDRNFLPVIKDFRLNERHYGALQGLNKKETQLKYGDEQTKIWRRSFKGRPPLLDKNDERNPAKQEMYRYIDKRLLPLSESLEDTFNRVVPYYNDVILNHIKLIYSTCHTLYSRTRSASPETYQYSTLHMLHILFIPMVSAFFILLCSQHFQNSRIAFFARSIS
jgi:2,3-bisphosphoglycerate-dependent phosphoglycerate mutase